MLLLSEYREVNITYSRHIRCSQKVYRNTVLSKYSTFHLFSRFVVCHWDSRVAFYRTLCSLSFQAQFPSFGLSYPRTQVKISWAECLSKWAWLKCEWGNVHHGSMISCAITHHSLKIVDKCMLSRYYANINLPGNVNIMTITPEMPSKHSFCFEWRDNLICRILLFCKGNHVKITICQTSRC